MASTRRHRRRGILQTNTGDYRFASLDDLRPLDVMTFSTSWTHMSPAQCDAFMPVWNQTGTCGPFGDDIVQRNNSTIVLHSPKMFWTYYSTCFGPTGQQKISKIKLVISKIHHFANRTEFETLNAGQIGRNDICNEEFKLFATTYSNKKESLTEHDMMSLCITLYTTL
ncbi:Aste57867_938 [Aphanomyces stellatus]|uniref:Aste57867_938 protein n=1 Tax=Aphanomyces stellatus TaxID=120398 RepID=A0A485K3X1_9STRA|nr:hypothetical protein As57867_000937 [Aphanomyces stellatus]VFT78161.1 Aste57867_938 [Aphanomyces stellatus]